MKISLAFPAGSCRLRPRLCTRASQIFVMPLDKSDVEWEPRSDGIINETYRHLDLSPHIIDRWDTRVRLFHFCLTSKGELRHGTHLAFTLQYRFAKEIIYAIQRNHAPEIVTHY